MIAGRTRVLRTTRGSFADGLTSTPSLLLIDLAQGAGTVIMCSRTDAAGAVPTSDPPTTLTGGRLVGAADIAPAMPCRANPAGQ